MSPDIEERLSQVDDLPRALEAIKVLVECVKFLEKENAQLKEKIARLEKNSSTSSKPPSSDIVKPPQAQRQRGVRKCGGQAGHKGSCRSKLKPDIIEPVHLESCPRCGCSELGKEDPKNVKFHQQAELVVKPVKVTQYNLHGRYCACCKRVRYPSLPAGVIQGHVFGPRLLSLCGYIKATIGASVSNITELFVDVFELPVSRGTIQNAIFRVSDSLQEPYDEALESLRKEKSLNVDETGWKENGKRFWVWLFCTPLIACFVIRPSRGSLVLKEILGEVFGGAITSDFYSAYVCYATAIQQFCLAHFIRDLKFLTTLSQDVSRIFGEKLLDYMKLIFALWHKRQDLTPEQFQNETSCLEASLKSYVFAQEFPKGSHARRIQSRMIKHWDSMFRFLKQPDLLDPTNNTAEQALRLLVHLRRISQGSRSLAGRLWTARAATVVVSCRKQQRSTWTFMQQAISSHFFNTSSPSLMPGN